MRRLVLAAICSVASAVMASPPVCEEVLAVERHGYIGLWSVGERGDESPRPSDHTPIAGGCAALDRSGSRLAYCTPVRDEGLLRTQLHVRTLDGSQPEWVARLGDGSSISELAWSPDGAQLAILETDVDFRSHVLLWRPGAPLRRLVSASSSDMGMWWSLGWMADGKALTVHDMRALWRISLHGAVETVVPLTELIDAGLETMTSTDRVLPAPHDVSLYAYTRLAAGTARFTRLMKEPSGALFVHDVRAGRAANQRLTAEFVTVLDINWAPDGQSLYFSGYLDSHAAEQDPFRIYRLDIAQHGLRELLRGEWVSVGCRPDSVKVVPR